MKSEGVRIVMMLTMLCFVILMAKYVISGAYFDYKLKKNFLLKQQSAYIDNNKRHIADIELYRSANYLFSYKDELGMKELTPEKTIILLDPIQSNGNDSKR